MSWVVKRFNLSASLAEASNSYSGRLAVAFMLNRVITPLRLVLCLLLVPKCAHWLNPWIEKITALFKKEEKKKE
jgi:hypothetical protein